LGLKFIVEVDYNSYKEFAELKNTRGDMDFDIIYDPIAFFIKIGTEESP
jgi:hypothetical protein